MESIGRRVQKLLRADILDILAGLPLNWQNRIIREEKCVKLVSFISVIHRWD